MAMIIPHRSREGISTAGGAGQAAQYKSASAFLTPGQSALPDALNSFAQGMDKVNKVVFDAALEKQRIRNSTAMLADQVALTDAYRAFDEEYRKNNKGESALNAPAEYEKFFEGQKAVLQGKWGGNPHLSQAAELMFQGVRQTGLRRASVYAGQEETAWRQGQLDARWTQVLTDAADSSLPYRDKAASFYDWEMSARMQAGQTFNPETGQYEGGLNVDAGLLKARRDWNLEIVEGMIAGNRLGEAKKYVREHSREFGDKADDALMKISAVERHNAATGRADAERQRKAGLDGVYSQWREEARKLDLTLEETQSLMTARISDKLADPADRTYVMAVFADDLKVETMRRDADDEVLGRNYREYVREKGLLPSQAVVGVESVRGLSAGGREKLVKSLQADAQKVTPEKMEALNDLKRLIDTEKVADQTQIDAFAFERGLTDKQAQNALEYLREGGNAAKVTVTRVDGIFKRMGRAKKMPDDLYQMVLDNLEPGKPATDERIRQTIANLYMSGENIGSGWFWDYDETYAEALREGGGSSWLPNLEGAEKRRIDSLFAANPETAKQWIDTYGGDAELAKRAYRKKELLGWDADEERGRK